MESKKPEPINTGFRSEDLIKILEPNITDVSSPNAIISFKNGMVYGIRCQPKIVTTRRG